MGRRHEDFIVIICAILQRSMVSRILLGVLVVVKISIDVYVLIIAPLGTFPKQHSRVLVLLVTCLCPMKPTSTSRSTSL